MDLIGRQIGPYRVISLLGAGGMGEVYRARDHKLGRDVAIKVLPAVFAADPDRLARFEREARLLATLNHPHIGAIHGFEESGGTRALVLELVEGPTLADRLASGPLPLSETFTIARQICEALEAAHEKGIIHRDLKPANIKITRDGQVKVLDFGLAKAATADASAPDLSHSPTVTVSGTRDGIILGTAAYMSPEQARGKHIDKRTDIWAFGCVLYEMLTGTSAFAGDDVSDTLARVLMKEAKWDLLPIGTPPGILKLLRRCLAKERLQRFSDAADARLEIDDAQTALSGETITQAIPSGQKPVWRRAMLPTACLLSGAMAAAFSVWLATRPAPPRVTRFTITPPAAAPLTLDAANGSVAISADGRRLVYVAANGTQLAVHALDQLVPTTLSGLGAPSQPVFSPDGQSIAFFDGANRLKKVATTGGTAVTLGPTVGPGGPGVSWGMDDTIVFGGVLNTGLMRVSAAGGEPEVLTTLDRTHGEQAHISPEVLPGGQAVLFTIRTPTDPTRTQVAVLDLRTGTRSVLVRGGFGGQYVSPGYLVYGVESTLRAVAFDIERLTVRGSPVPVVEGVMTAALGRADFDVAADGTLVYLSGGAQAGAQRSLVWVNRQGQEQPLAAPTRAYVYPRLSPDGKRLAISVTDQENDIWIWELSRQLPLTKFTFDAGMDLLAVWTPDGRRLVWGSQRAGPPDIYWQAADGTGAVERLTETGEYPMSVSPDGTRLVLRRSGKTRQDLMVLGLDKERRVTPLIQTPFNEQNGEISPDGRWLAYESDESGQLEIYVRPFPNVETGRWLVSTAGGKQPLWARSGRELFYRTPDGTLMGVSVEIGGSGDRGAGFSVGTPVSLVKGQNYYVGSGAFLGRTYDVSPDGQRFLMIKERGAADGSAAPPPSIVVVQNWVEELKRLVPVSGK